MFSFVVSICLFKATVWYVWVCVGGVDGLYANFCCVRLRLSGFVERVVVVTIG